MKKEKRSLIYSLILLAVALVLIPKLTVSASSSKITDEQINKIFSSYKDILIDVDGRYKDEEGCGFVAESFDLKDLDLDGIPELIVNQDVPQIFTYDLKNDRSVWLWSSWVLNSPLFYSEKEKRLMCVSTFQGTNWSFYSFPKDKDDVTLIQYIEDISIWYAPKNRKVDKKIQKKGYYLNDKLVTKTVAYKKIEQLMPGKVKLTTKIKNTEENRNKYLTLEYVR